MQSLFLQAVVFLASATFITTAVSIRHSQILISHDSTYVVNHPTHQMGHGVSSDSLLQCVYLCQNDDYCRTAVFGASAMRCLLFEECSSFGDIISHPTRTVISFQLCDDEPERMAFSAPLTASVPVLTVMSNLT